MEGRGEGEARARARGEAKCELFTVRYKYLIYKK